MIGIFDSGVGGLTVVREIIKDLPKHQLIYFGDTARLPYGTKGADFVKKYSSKITRWLLDNGAQIIIVACNTSSAWASSSLKEKFKKVPIFEMITPAVEQAVETTKNKKIGIIGTPGTVKSKIYEKKLLKADKSIKVYSVACPLLVSLVEEGMVTGKITEEIIKNYIQPIEKKGIDTLILGCTHYPLLKETIEKVIDKRIKVINPAKKLSEDVKNFLINNPKIEDKIKKGDNNQFFFSDNPYNLAKISKLCLGRNIKAVIIDPFA